MQRLRAEAEFEAYESEEVVDEMYDAEADSADDDDYDASLESSERKKDLGTPV